MGGHLTRWLDRILAKPIRYLFETPKRLLKGYVEPGMTVLDVGCGEGYYSLGMARAVGPKGRVICVDTQAEAITVLRKKAEDAGLAGWIETRVSAERDLALGDLSGQVDFALAVYVIHHAADVAGLMGDVYEALRPGGRFLIVEPKHHASRPDCEATEAAARKAGLKVADHPRLKRDWAAVFVKP